VFTAPRELSGAYHTYGVLLTASAVSWFIDGVCRGQTSRSLDEATPMFVIATLATGKCGDGWAGCPHNLQTGLPVRPCGGSVCGGSVAAEDGKSLSLNGGAAGSKPELRIWCSGVSILIWYEDGNTILFWR
jgi:hypothetical protein